MIIITTYIVAVTSVFPAVVIISNIFTFWKAPAVMKLDRYQSQSAGSSSRIAALPSLTVPPRLWQVHTPVEASPGGTARSHNLPRVRSQMRVRFLQRDPQFRLQY